MAAKSATKTSTTKSRATPSRPKPKQTTLVPTEWAKNAAANNAARAKAKPAASPNGNIMAFFKKAEEQNNRIFLAERGAKDTFVIEDADDEEGAGWTDEAPVITPEDNPDTRYNEVGGSIKRRRLSANLPEPACSPPPPEAADVTVSKPLPEDASVEAEELPPKPIKKAGPFIDDSDSEMDEEIPIPRRGTIIKQTTTEDDALSKPPKESAPAHDDGSSDVRIPASKSETPPPVGDDFDGFDDLEDDDLLEGEEYDERRWMEQQRKLEMAESGFEGDEDIDSIPMFPEDDAENDEVDDTKDAPACPICNTTLAELSDQQISVHVNACLDGNPISPPELKENTATNLPATSSKMFKRPPRPAKPGQQNPFQLGDSSTGAKSAFSKIMSSHAEDSAWASAAASESAARGKPSYQRTCPFYKILPGFYICVDAFRYGAVKGQNAYFLSHFHSDHYVGLTKSWSHGPIYCSKVTGNLVRQQLGVDPKWVVDLEWEKKTEVPGTEGVHVTMIPANHCPGSSLFLFEKQMGQGKNPKLQRVLHCGDFRACRAHVEHPLLRPDVIDAVSGKSRQQKLDVCYLDTTYLNPKYAFPPQEQVIQACADMCVSLNKERADEEDAWEQVKRDRAGQGMINFVRKDSETGTPTEDQPDTEDVDAMKVTNSGPTRKRGRLLVVVGTYSIGKERICMGIAKALDSKIYAPPAKQRICRALEDPELQALLTTDPRAAQVHMTPLFEIRAETLSDYLADYRDVFSRAVGFRPSGWNYRPPKTRFTESPAVQTVLHSKGWRSEFSMRNLQPQRGNTARAACFGVPYSEHSSFRELTMFCCALRIDRIIPTVNVGSAKSREKMKVWCERWAADRRKNGLFRVEGDAW